VSTALSERVAKRRVAAQDGEGGVKSTVQLNSDSFRATDTAAMSRTPPPRTRRHARQAFARHPVAMLAFACALLPGCPSGNHAPATAVALAQPQAPLSWRVNHARVTHHLATSSLESRDALPGHQFVVLDVSVHNRDTQPQVLSEGKLIALDETTLQTFDQPETLLSDDYLSLQVLAPAQSLHGKIAYEVPEPLSGVLYWSPGNGSERILLNPVTAPAATPADDVADISAGGAIAPTGGEETGASAATARVPASAGSGSPKLPATSRRDRVAAQRPPATQRPPARAIVIDKPGVAPSVTETRSPPVLAPTTVPTPSQQSARIAAAPPLPIAGPVATRPVVATTPAPDERDLVRRNACAALVARDDPADKAGNLDFFAESCRDYTLPAHWSAPAAPHRSLIARVASRASALLARVVAAPHVVRISDCGATASHADRLVCADPGLSAMDHRLAQSVARATDQVDDPAALWREQERWRGRVRDACDTARCLERAYGQRIAQLDALAPMRP
jgi:hypothetical protein